MFREIGNRGHPAMISPNDPRQRLCLCASAEISRELKVDTAESSIIALEPFHGGVVPSASGRKWFLAGHGLCTAHRHLTWREHPRR